METYQHFHYRIFVGADAYRLFSAVAEWHTAAMEQGDLPLPICVNDSHKVTGIVVSIDMTNWPEDLEMYWLDAWAEKHNVTVCD